MVFWRLSIVGPLFLYNNDDDEKGEEEGEKEGKVENTLVHWLRIL